jgi:hypothetical protein
MDALACSCGVRVPPDAVDFDLRIAACPSCGSVFALPQELPLGAILRTEADGAGVRVADDRVSWGGDARRGGLLSFLSLLVVGAVFHAMREPTDEGAPLLPLVLFAIVLVLSTLSQFLQRTELRVDDGVVTVVSRPLGGTTMLLAASEIRGAWVSGSGDDEDPTFRLCVRTEGGGDRVLVGGFASASRARFVEEWLEAHLGLPDLPIPGELR